MRLKSEYSSYQLLIVGCGGTGSALLYFLSRFLHSLDKNILVTLIDGDVVEEKNVLRQSFAPADIGENKAKALSIRYGNLLGIQMSYADKFINSIEDVDGLILPNRFPIIVGCLDNTKTRCCLQETFDTYNTIIYLDAGNGSNKGQTVFGLRYFGSTTLPAVGNYFPELIHPEPEQTQTKSYSLGCADVQDQTMSANFLSAHLLFSYLSNILVGTEWRHMSLFDTSMDIINKSIEDCAEFNSSTITGYSYAGRIKLVQ